MRDQARREDAALILILPRSMTMEFFTSAEFLTQLATFLTAIFSALFTSLLGGLGGTA